MTANTRDTGGLGFLQRFISPIALFLGPLCVLLLSSVHVRSDGFFVFRWNKAVDINEPTQKAIIVYDQGREDLLLQVKYEGRLKISAG